MKASEHRPLSKELNELLKGGSEPLTVSVLSERIGDRGFGMLLVVLSLPSALPVPAAGYSIPFGLLLLWLAFQMLAGRHKPMIPRRLSGLKLSGSLVTRLLKSSAWLLGKVELLVRPRMRWITRRAGQVLMGSLVLLMAILMMIPIPMTNTAPAAVIFLIGVGLTEEDGLFAIGACAIGSVAALLYATLVYLVIAHGPEVVEQLKELLLSILPI